MSISITVKYKEMTDNDEDNDDESDKHLEARDCRMYINSEIFVLNTFIYAAEVYQLEFTIR